MSSNLEILCSTANARSVRSLRVALCSFSALPANMSHLSMRSKLGRPASARIGSRGFLSQSLWLAQLVWNGWVGGRRGSATSWKLAFGLNWLCLWSRRKEAREGRRQPWCGRSRKCRSIRSSTVKFLRISKLVLCPSGWSKTCAMSSTCVSCSLLAGGCVEQSTYPSCLSASDSSYGWQAARVS